MQYVTTAKQHADMLTKVIDGALFHKSLPYLFCRGYCDMECLRVLTVEIHSVIFTWHL